MSKVSDFLSAAEAFNAQRALSDQAILEAVVDLDGDITELNRQIAELQNSPDRVTAEDAERITALELKLAEDAEKSRALVAAIQTAADRTPPVVPAPPPDGEPA